jgi:phosphoserine aminotransferase
MGDIAMTTIPRPAVRPARPEFSSGPCAKRPGWAPENLSNAVLGRSHRSKIGKARLKEAIDRTREVLQVPDDYLIGMEQFGTRIQPLMKCRAGKLAKAA